MLKLICGLLKHVMTIIKLEHDGTGLPTELSSALLFSSIYSLLVTANNIHADTFDYSVCLSLIFVTVIYSFVLRNQITGLIVLIGIVSNLMALLLSQFGSLSELQRALLAVMEYVMVFCALTNVIKSHIKLH